MYSQTDGSYYPVNAYSFIDSDENEIGGMYGRDDTGQNDLEDKVARQLLLALTMDTRSRAVDHYHQTQNELAQLRQLIETQAQTVDKLAATIQAQDQYLKDHPPLLYLLRYRTKETIATILFVVIVLSGWYVSGIRQPILKWLGLPPF